MAGNVGKVIWQRQPFLVNPIITNLLSIQLVFLLKNVEGPWPSVSSVLSLLLPPSVLLLLALALCTSPTGESTALALYSAAETQGR